MDIIDHVKQMAWENNTGYKRVFLDHWETLRNPGAKN